MTTKTQAQRLREIRAAGIRTETYSTCALGRRCVERSTQTTATLLALRMELQNFMQHGRLAHADDWYHQWARTSRGTLSWNC